MATKKQKQLVLLDELYWNAFGKRRGNRSEERAFQALVDTVSDFVLKDDLTQPRPTVQVDPMGHVQYQDVTNTLSELVTGTQGKADVMSVSNFLLSDVRARAFVHDLHENLYGTQIVAGGENFQETQVKEEAALNNMLQTVYVSLKGGNKKADAPQLEPNHIHQVRGQDCIYFYTVTADLYEMVSGNQFDTDPNKFNKQTSSISTHVETYNKEKEKRKKARARARKKQAQTPKFHQVDVNTAYKHLLAVHEAAVGMHAELTEYHDAIASVTGNKSIKMLPSGLAEIVAEEVIIPSPIAGVYEMEIANPTIDGSTTRGGDQQDAFYDHVVDQLKLIDGVRIYGQKAMQDVGDANDVKALRQILKGVITEDNVMPLVWTNPESLQTQLTDYSNLLATMSTFATDTIGPSYKKELDWSTPYLDGVTLSAPIGNAIILKEQIRANEKQLAKPAIADELVSIYKP